MIANLADAEVVISEQAATIETLRAELERVKGERDEARQDFGGYDERCEFLQGEYSKMLRELEAAIVERDEARRWAGALLRSVRMWRFMAHDYAAAMTRKHAVELYLTAKQNLTDPNGWHKAGTSPPPF